MILDAVRLTKNVNPDTVPLSVNIYYSFNYLLKNLPRHTASPWGKALTRTGGRQFSPSHFASACFVQRGWPVISVDGVIPGAEFSAARCQLPL